MNGLGDTRIATRIPDFEEFSKSNTLHRVELMRRSFENEGVRHGMNDLINRQAAIDALWKIKDERDSVYYTSAIHSSIDAIRQLPSAQPKRKKNAVQKFHDYQVKWLKSHYDIELDPQLEKMIVQFLHDTANCYMMEVEHDGG